MRFDLSDEEWVVIEPLLPLRVRGPERVDGRKILNGIFYILRTGRRGETCPSATALAPRLTTAIRKQIEDDPLLGIKADTGKQTPHKT